MGLKFDFLKTKKWVILQVPESIAHPPLDRPWKAANFFHLMACPEGSRREKGPLGPSLIQLVAPFTQPPTSNFIELQGTQVQIALRQIFGFFFFFGRRVIGDEVGAVVRAITFHQCDQSSILKLDDIF